MANAYFYDKIIVIKWYQIMLNSKFLCGVMLAGIMPGAALASIAYTPTRPCACLSCCTAQPSHAQPNNNVQSVAPRSSGNMEYEWYLSANVAMNLWSWGTEYESDYSGTNISFDNDDYSFESVFGGSVAIGKQFESGMRADVELGLSSEFSDSDEIARYSLSAPYVMANVYYDFDSGVFLGAGLGITRPEVKLDGSLFENKEYSKTGLSIKVGATVGYSAHVSDNAYVDFKYRLSGFRGPDLTNAFLWDQYVGTDEVYSLNVKTGIVFENALSVGVRFYF